MTNCRIYIQQQKDYKKNDYKKGCRRSTNRLTSCELEKQAFIKLLNDCETCKLLAINSSPCTKFLTIHKTMADIKVINIHEQD